MRTKFNRVFTDIADGVGFGGINVKALRVGPVWDPTFTRKAKWWVAKPGDILAPNCGNCWDPWEGMRLNADRTLTCTACGWR